jgi:hypothetical protein
MCLCVFLWMCPAVLVPDLATRRASCAVGADRGEQQSVKCLGLVNENVAVALAYGMYRSAKGEFDLTSETVTMFVDMGDASFTYVRLATEPLLPCS